MSIHENICIFLFHIIYKLFFFRNSVAKMRQDAAANSAHEEEISRARSADQGEGEEGEDVEGKGKSTTVSRILQQISSRLVTLMHEVGT